eukprot:5366385-Pleurochrysis_carterae.AAC.2
MQAGLAPSVLRQEGALQGPYVFALSSESPPAEPPLPPIESQLRDELQACAHSTQCGGLATSHALATSQ